MSYQVLARKWRPQVFEDVVGQGHITRTLQNAIATNRLAHAFLFSGPRGVGKTTTARILAKALNCKKGPTPNPCGTCDSCRETAAGTSVDVMEIDGASNRGIEHIRDLREAVKYAPVGGKYKVYVIDEVHMLTNEAFNALLKTLEEPPPHVLFIFATTEPQKIPATIHSRCQRYGFKRISIHEISAKLREIANKEQISVSDQGLAMIARAAEGSMRDSQSLLDQAVSYSGMTITDADLQNILGAVAQQTLTEFTDRLLARDTAGLLEQIDLLLEQGQDMRQFLGGLVEHIRNLLIARTTKDPGQIIERSTPDVEAIQRQSATTDTERLLLLFDGLSMTLDALRWSPHQRFTFEIGVMKACSQTPLRPINEVLARVQELEAMLASAGGSGAGSREQAVREPSAGYRAVKKTASHREAAESGMTGSPVDAWGAVVAALKQKKPGLASALGSSEVLESTDAALVIGVPGTAFQLQQVEKKENRELIEKTIEEVLQKRTQVRFQPFGGSGERPSPKPAAKKTEAQARDPLEQDILSIFNGTMVDPENTGP